MIGKLAILLLAHTAFSTLRWRKYVQANQEPFFLPLDIALQLLLATILTIITILAHTNKFKILKQFTQTTSYDASFHKPNFKNYRTSRAQLLLPYLKQRLATEDFSLDLKL